MDIDPAAEHIAVENAARNGFGPDRFTALTGNVVTDEALMRRLGGNYDLVCANIVADVIIGLVPVVPGLLRQGGTFLCSGVLDVREDEVRRAIKAAGLTLCGGDAMGEWRCLIAKKP